ncbi:transporter [Acinetobacter sp. YH16032]|uniref:transporter n=1 Tax=Acinetobacter sp. YH16032 TaxID=2601181 RepID=UPI0015D121D4|nr:transporter [Acinetobacter sp. YH16032]
MTKLKQLSLILCSTASVSAMAADFAFDRPGTSFSTGITPVGQLAWEQGLPTAQYVESTENGFKNKSLRLNADVLLRTGLSKNTELQLGWDGPAWERTRIQNRTDDHDGLGDVSVGIKHHVDLQDDQLKMAILAQAKIATGNDRFTYVDDIYTLGSSVEYQYNDTVTTGIGMFYSAQNSDWSVTAVPTIGYKIVGNLSGYSEAVFTKKESQEREYGLASGLIYALNDRAQLDASIGLDLSGSDRSYHGGFGVSYLF